MKRPRKLHGWFPLLLIVIWGGWLLMPGCGGGGGGRQVLPGENPVGPGTGTGTGSGTGAGTGTGTGTGSGSGVGTGTGTGTASPTTQLANGWIDMGYANYYGAMDKFQAVIANPAATAAERSEAYNGLGWARGKAFGMSAGVSDFSQAGDLTEAKVGLAFGLIQKADGSSISQAIGILEGLGMGAPGATVSLPHPATGVTNAEIHAMLAYAYFWRNSTGDEDKARSQILAARGIDSSATSPVGQIHATLKKMGLSGI